MIFTQDSTFNSVAEAATEEMGKGKGHPLSLWVPTCP